jgi:RNA polymerase sigma-B factor
MTSLTPPAVLRSVDAPPDGSVEASTKASRRERRTRTETILASRQRCSDPDERQRLQQEVLLLNLRVADGIAARYAGRGIERDDLVQVARLALFKAIVGYHSGKGPGFTAYARPTIAGEIKRHFRDHGWMVKPPRRLQEIHSQLRLVEPDLEQQLHRAPSGHEVAHALGVDQAELSEALIATGGYTALSLNAPTHPGSDLSLGDDLPDDTDLFQAVEQAEWLRPALARLTNRERRIIQLRFADGHSQEQIGAHLGVSQMQVSRLLVGILARLRDDLGTTLTEATA